MERETLLVPINYCHSIVSDSIYEAQAEEPITSDILTMPEYKPDDDIFLSLLHVALKVRSDLLAQTGHLCFNVSEENAISCVPDSLYMLLNLLYGGIGLEWQR